jgi:hypothetical protein
MAGPDTHSPPPESLRDSLRGLAITLTAGLFLTFSGAFNTGEAPLLQRLIYWLPVMAAGYLWGSFVTRRLMVRARRLTDNVWLIGAAASMAMSIPFTLVVWVATRYVLGSDLGLSGIPFLFLYVWLVSAVLTAINLLVETRRTALTHADPAPPKFLERLPLKLRGAEIWAVEAEDHYLRLHTSKGQDLILLRLADAVDELQGIEGAQVHRSWWVARDAITDAKRGDGRATLTLKDGAEVPVSRTYAGLLRERGWI